MRLELRAGSTLVALLGGNFLWCGICAFAPPQPPLRSPFNPIPARTSISDLAIQTQTNPRSSGALHMFSPEGGDIASSSFLTAIQVFDGSAVDPVVVSNAFWDGITRQFVSLIIGQFLAVTVFGVFTTFAGSQISKMGTFVSESIFKQPKNAGLKQPPPGYTGGLRVEPNFSRLLICIIIDVIGTSSELIPFVGELTDLAWAPIAALLLRNIYGSNVVFALEFAEEFFPYTDALPLACICWVVDTYFAESEAAKVLQLGIYSSKEQEYDASTPEQNSDGWRRDEVTRREGGVIDVEVQNIDSGSERQLPPERRNR